MGRHAGSTGSRTARSRTVVPLLLAVTRTAVLAQGPAETPVACDGKTVSQIVITARDPSFLSFPTALRPFARGVGLHHTTSKADAIGSFVLLEAGGRCSERQRAETERILRLQPFLAEATVRTVDDGLGGVRIEVETVDEIPTVFAMRFDGALPSAVRFGNGNVRGLGLHLAGNLERGFAYRSGMGVEGTAYQVLGRPYTLSFVAERAPLGRTLSLAVGHAFLTDLQRTAWHVGFMDVNRFLRFVPPEGDELSLGVERRLWDLGGVRRFGLGRRSAFAGVLLTAESVTPADGAVIVSDSGLVADTTSALGGPVASYRNLRLNVVLGVRALSFAAVRGFDALAAVQDVATGMQLGTMVGWGIPRFGASDDDRLFAVDLYAGYGSDRSFAGVRVKGEARMDAGSGRRDSLVGSGRLAWYFKPASAHVLIGSLEFGGGRRLRVPFQLLLGQHRGGVRGYAGSRLAGAVRTVLRLEERWFVGGLTRHGSFGLSSFADAGWVRAGDAPFGADSGIKVGVGVGLLAAFPQESQRLWRLDIAVPVSSDPHASWEVRLTSMRIRSFWREPGDVARGRTGAAPSRIFGWP